MYVGPLEVCLAGVPRRCARGSAPVHSSNVVNTHHLLPVFAALWISLMIAGALFQRKASVATKRRWHPRMVIGGALVFASFLCVVLPSVRVLAIFLPAVAVFCFLSLKLTKFCSACGAMVVRTDLNPVRFCPRCGAAVDGSAG